VTRATGTPRLCILCDEPGHYRSTCPNPKRTLRDALLWREDMARSKKDDGTVSAKGEVSPPVSLSEVEEKLDIDREEGDADLEAVQRAGAVSTESVALNAQTRDVITTKRDRSRRIRWNDDNAQVVYDSIRQAGWNTASSYIMCRRVTGEPMQWSVACSAVPSGLALHEWVLTKCHKSSPAHTYEIQVRDSHTNQERGRGKLHMPDTLGDGAAQGQAPQQQPPPQVPNPYGFAAPNPYAPQGFAQPQWYPGMPGAPFGSAPQQPPPAPAAPSAPAPAPPVQASGDPIADLRAQFGYLSGQLAQLLTKQGAPQPPAPPPPTVVVAPAPAPPQSAAPPPPQTAPQAAPGVPAGFVLVPEFGYVRAELVRDLLMSHVRGSVGPQPAAPPPPPAPRPIEHPPTGLGGLPLPRPEPPSIAQMIGSATRNMKETAGGLAAMVSAVDEIRDALGHGDRAEVPGPVQKNGDPAKRPFEILEAGPVRIPYDPETGDLKGLINLGLVNGDKIGAFVGNLYTKAAQAMAQAAQQQAAQQQPPGVPPGVPPGAQGRFPPPLPNGAAQWPPPAPLPRT
jgi:hypothetical protein